MQQILPQSDQFRSPKPVPVGKQDHGGVPITVAAEASCGSDQPIDFRWRQVFPATPIGVGELLAVTMNNMAQFALVIDKRVLPMLRPANLGVLRRC
jgi:hypothetical protein